MDRADALDYLLNEFSVQLGDTGLASTDTADGLKPVIDSALRELGIARADWPAAVVDEDDEGAFEAFLRYFALEKFATLLAQNINIGTGGKNFSLQQAFANVKALLDMATVKAKGYGLSGNGVYSLQTLDLSFGGCGSEF